MGHGMPTGQLREGHKVTSCSCSSECLR